MVYIGLTEKDFKTRYNNKILKIRKKKKKKKHDVTPTLKWSIIKRVRTYNKLTKRCSLCLTEKYEILKYPLRDEQKKQNYLQMPPHEQIFNG